MVAPAEFESTYRDGLETLYYIAGSIYIAVFLVAAAHPDADVLFSDSHPVGIAIAAFSILTLFLAVLVFISHLLPR